MIELIQKKLLSRKCRNGELPESVCRYLRRFDEGFHAQTPIKEARFVIYDTETTGFDFRHDRIISIGAVGMKGGGDRCRRFVRGAAAPGSVQRT